MESLWIKVKVTVTDHGRLVLIYDISNQFCRGSSSFSPGDPLCVLMMVIYLVHGWFGEMPISERGRGRG